MADIQGKCADRFANVRAAFERNLDSGQDMGAAVAVFVDGAPVVDLWGGYLDATYTRPWQRDTIVQLYSSTKTITALCALVLADRGGIDLDAPVATYWPEFGAQGKRGVLVKHLLGHSSGLAGWTEHMSIVDMLDREKSTELLARQAPWWEPGRASGYHGYNMGHLVGEVIRRATGKTLGSFLTEEIAGPLGVGEEYYIGTPESADARVSLLVQGMPHDRPLGTRFGDAVFANPLTTPQSSWQIPWRRAELGAVNGHGNARAIAAMQSLVASGHANGKRLLSDKGRERMLEPQSEGADLVLGIPARWGMGYSLDGTFFGAPPAARVGWWGGNGGSISYVDLDARMSLGFTPNRWLGGDFPSLWRARDLIRAAYESLAGVESAPALAGTAR